MTTTLKNPEPKAAPKTEPTWEQLTALPWGLFVEAMTAKTGHPPEQVDRHGTKWTVWCDGTAAIRGTVFGWSGVLGSPGHFLPSDKFEGAPPSADPFRRAETQWDYWLTRYERERAEYRRHFRTCGYTGISQFGATVATGPNAALADGATRMEECVKKLAAIADRIAAMPDVSEHLKHRYAMLVRQTAGA